MKKIFALIVFMLMAVTSWAHDVEIDGIYYNLIEKGKEAHVTYKGTSCDEYCDEYYGTVIIPSSFVYNGATYSVISIEDTAFQGCSGITSVTIGNSVTSIGHYAFHNCSGLTTVTIPNSLTSIGSNAFYFCSNLTSVHITSIESWCKVKFEDYYSNPLSYAHNLYLNYTEVKDLVIPNTVTSIGALAFYGCSSITSVSIPNSVTSIGNSAFEGCSGLTSVTIPNSVTNIGISAFSCCFELVSVIIPNSVTIIGSNTFSGCFGLTSVTIPNSVTRIEWHAFDNCSALTSVTIPNSVISIGEGCFYGCSSLTSVTIPNSVMSIGEGAFYGCIGLASVTIGNSVTGIGEYAFFGCSGLTSVTIGNSVKHINSMAFSNCKKLETVTCLAENVPNTYTNAFSESYVNYSTLIVPEASLPAYKSTAPWSEFGTFKTVEGGSDDTKKCAKPSIAYEDGKLYFSTATPNAEVVSDIIDADVKRHYDACVPLTARYNITAYATKPGYDDSDVATATLVWATATLTPGEETSAKEITVNALPLLVTQDNGILTVSGIQDGETVTAYSTNGAKVAMAKAIGNAALLNLSELQGKVAVLNVGGKSAKVMVK